MQTSELRDPCQLLRWDSDYFGIKIGQVIGHNLSANGIDRIQSWCVDNKIKCLYFLADLGHDETIVLAQNHAFRLVDVRLELAANIKIVESLAGLKQKKPLANSRIREGITRDIPFLEEIAYSAHKDSRFYHDGRFPRDKCSDLYSTWIRNSFNGFADQVFVAEFEDRVVGYITCSKDRIDLACGKIGLLGVEKNKQGLGIGSNLVASALRWFFEQSVTCVAVVTQGRNIHAQRLYQRHGFSTQSMNLWYHKWF